MLSVAIAFPSDAATRFVNAAATGTNNGASWANAFTDLQNGIVAAGSGDEVWVARGTYKPTPTTSRLISFTLKNGVGIYGGFLGNETLRTQRDWNANPTILSGEIGTTAATDNSVHVVTDNGTNSTAILDGFTITGGYADQLSGLDSFGAGILITGSSSFANCTVTGNFAAQQGGAAAMSNGPPGATFSNCLFRLNSAANGVGGVIGGSASFTGCKFDRNRNIAAAFNTAAAAFGGQNATFDGCTFTNHARTTVQVSGPSTFRGCVFRANVAGTNSNDAVIRVSNASATTIVNSVFDGNHAGRALIYTEGSGTAIVANTVAVNNSSDGSASWGVFCNFGAGLTVGNNIIWGNTGSMVCSGSGAVPITYSDVQDVYSGAGNLQADPQFINGGDPADVHLSGSSLLLVDAGDNGSVPPGTTTDFDGGARFVDNASVPDTGLGIPPIVDIGADEFTTAPVGFNLSVLETGPGSGTIVSSPAAIQCGRTCSANFASGTMVTLTAVPDPGNTFRAWSGACSGMGTCTVTMNVATSVKAIFAPLRFVNTGAGGGNNGLTWSDGFTSLATALSSAPPGSEIWVKAGTYTPGATRDATFALNDGVEIYGGFNGSETSRNQRDFGTNVTILSGEIGASGEADNSQHVVSATVAVTTPPILDGFTITGGNSDSAPFPGGGGMLLLTSAKVRNCRIIGNRAATASNFPGGGVVAASNAGPASTSFTNCVFSENSARRGGALVVYSNVTAQLTNCTIAGNSAIDAASAISIQGGTASVVNSIIWGNDGPSLFDTALPITYSIVEGGAAGTGNLASDPLFSSDSNLRLRSGSPAIDAGNNAAFASDAGTLDLSGLPRFTNDPLVPDTGVGSSPIIDLGAYELAPDRLVVTTTGVGAGTVTSVPPGTINCGSVCVATLARGTTVTLVATPSGASRFNGWEGDCSGIGSCVVTVPANVTARFGRVWFVKTTAFGSNNGTSWANAFTDLQNGLAAAIRGDDVWVAAGTYKPTASTDRSASFNLKSSVGVFGGFAGTEVLRSAQNPTANATILSGEIAAAGTADNSIHVVTGTGVISSAILDGFTITAGNADGSIGGLSGSGGGAYLENSSAVINQCTITGNAGQNVGGLFAFRGKPSVRGSMIAGNSSPAFGGVFLQSGAGNLTDCTISGNSGNFVAGVYATTGARLTRCVIENNTGSSGTAGAAIQENTILENSTMRGNTGRGLFIVQQATGTPRVSGSFITGNSIGGMSIGGPAIVTNTTIAGNTGFGVAGSGTFTNCVVAANTFGQVSGSATFTYSDITGGRSGTGNINADPQFINAAGGNYRLMPASPCIDAGDNSVVGSSMTIDIAGKPRRTDVPLVTDTGLGAPPIVDMGADEVYPITITGPASATVCTGGSNTFNVVADGWGALSYQWRKNTQAIPGKNTPSLMIGPAAGTDDADYDILVTDSLGMQMASAMVHLGVATTAVINTPPSSIMACPGEPAMLTVSAGGGYLSYQWRKGGNPISGATGPVYQIGAASQADVGSYDVQVTNACSVVATSASVTISLQDETKITTQPQAATLCETDPLDLSVSATGPGTLTYQWRLGGSPIQGANGSTYHVDQTAANQGGLYDVVVGSTVCTTTVASAQVLVTVNTKPVVTMPPTNKLYSDGAIAVFVAGASGQPSPAVQWQRNDGSGFANIPGATSTTLSLPVTTADNGHLFRAVFTNSCATIASAVATLTIRQFTDPTIVMGSTPVRLIHFTEIRDRIAEHRMRFGLNPFPYTHSTLDLVTAVDVTEARQALEEAYTAAARTVPSYTNTISANVSSVYAIDLEELRTACVALE